MSHGETRERAGDMFQIHHANAIRVRGYIQQFCHALTARCHLWLRTFRSVSPDNYPPQIKSWVVLRAMFVCAHFAPSAHLVTTDVSAVFSICHSKPPAQNFAVRLALQPTSGPPGLECRHFGKQRKCRLSRRRLRPVPSQREYCRRVQNAKIPTNASVSETAATYLPRESGDGG